MYKSLFFGLFFFVSFPVLCQPFFEEYRDQEAVSYLSINPMMFRLMGQMNIQTDDPETRAYLDMIKSIRSFKVLVTGDAEISQSLETVLKKWATSEDLRLLMQLDDSDNQLWFYAEMGVEEDLVKRLLMFSRGKGLEDTISIQGKKLQSVLLLMEGDIDLTQIGKLTETMELPGGDQLKKVKQK